MVTSGRLGKITMKTEDKTPVQRVRVAVLGTVNVGKSALTVRYLTRRYIGEYRSKTDLLYRQTISLDSGLLDVEIVDISTETDDDFPTEQIQWADSCLIVYSITDRESFKYATKALGNLKSLQSGPSAYLIANKSDLDHLRTVSECEGATLAATHNVEFCEVSVADNTPNLYKAFERILNDSKGRPVKQRKFSVSKMIGTLIGTSETKPNPLNSGTMVPCCKEELHKSRTKTRRQGFITTASL